MNLRRILLALLFAGVFAVACTATMDAPRGLSAADSTALRAIAERDAAMVLARDFADMSAGYTVDAVRMPPNGPALVGRAAILASLEQMPPITTFGFRLRDLQGDGEIAYMRASRTQAREMRGERGGAEAGVAEVILNEREGDARFEEMRGVAVPERMHMGALVHAALFDRARERALQRGPSDGRRGKHRSGMTAGGSVPRRKEPEWIAVRAPVRAQERERGVGERHVAIRAALAVDVEQRAIAVNVRHLQTTTFHEAKRRHTRGAGGPASGVGGAMSGDPLGTG